MVVSNSLGVASHAVLIVGDAPLGRGLLTLVLTRLGYVTSWVASAQEALDACGGTDFAIVLAALELPDAPGLALARRLRATVRPQGAIVMFGHAPAGTLLEQACRELRLADCLPKPVPIGRLVATMRALITRQQQEQRPLSTIPLAAPPAPVELSHLHSFTEGDEAFERELASLYLDTADAYLAQMRVACGQGGAWDAAAHALKGASANIGARQVAQLAAAAEKVLPDAAILHRLSDAIEAVRSFFAARGTPARAA